MICGGAVLLCLLLSLLLFLFLLLVLVLGLWVMVVWIARLLGVGAGSRMMSGYGGFRSACVGCEGD